MRFATRVDCVMFRFVMMKLMDGGLLGVAAGVTGAAAFLGHAVRGRSSSFFGPSVYRGDRARRALALTFDDGPSESTPALLRILAAHQIRATFFMCGTNVRRWPRIAQDVLTAGHAIGHHTDTHPPLHFHSPA